jgi:hypothetical protein
MGALAIICDQPVHWVSILQNHWTRFENRLVVTLLISAKVCSGSDEHIADKLTL